jgi:hypothetical protein
MIAAMILFPIAVGIAVWCITVSSITKLYMWLLLLIPSIYCAIIGITLIASIPTNKDVRDGEAHYIEQIHIEVVNGDTVNTYKTYKIEWNQNTK